MQLTLLELYYFGIRSMPEMCMVLHRNRKENLDFYPNDIEEDDDDDDNDDVDEDYDVSSESDDDNNTNDEEDDISTLIDDLIELGTIRLLDWNDAMTDIQLDMRFVDKIQAISAVQKWTI
ncbi:hypothetical protein M9H77_16181 [Catharanthus roseus]|uniref:Uncharacterized protein n=1 Tax=Catharanthus roseus TaxID=4058 RepID=A0ACC0AZ88_CATRO|nr:hypothetical protein M9H77_16181 [Catharanthus roseus]